MKEILLKNFVSNAKESTTFSMNTGPDFVGLLLTLDLLLEVLFSGRCRRSGARRANGPIFKGPKL